jgi:hypothetical protein
MTTAEANESKKKLSYRTPEIQGEQPVGEATSQKGFRLKKSSIDGNRYLDYL